MSYFNTILLVWTFCDNKTLWYLVSLIFKHQKISKKLPKPLRKLFLYHQKSLLDRDGQITYIYVMDSSDIEE